MKRFLVTTALEETWRDDQPVLFLGEWCRRYDRKEKWQGLAAEVVPYHWDDRKKLHQDYLYLQNVYEELLAGLSVQLNALHGVDHSIRYWRILVGPWLGYFIQMLFDRWTMLRHAIAGFDIEGTRVVSGEQSSLVPNDTEGFLALCITDAWNEAICGELLEWMGVPIEPVAGHAADDESLSRSAYRIGLKRRLKRALARAASGIFGMLGSEREYFFITSYLPIKQDLLLQWRLGQIPKLWHSVKSPAAVANQAARRQQAVIPGDVNDFPAIARTMALRHIPTAYREGYRSLLAVTQKLPWPRQPKAIFTSNSWASDDVFKAWAADKAEGGAPLLIGQHGGSYGIALWGFTEDHQIAIADRFLTWGWTQADQRKVVPVGNFKGFGKAQTTDKHGVALMVEMVMPRTSHHMYSVPVAHQWLGYFEDQCRFVQALPQHLRDQLLVRLYTIDYGQCQRQRWQDRFPSIRLDEGLQPMAKLIARSRLYISTYNATTYLETMSLNIPTIMFWNPEHWELRASAVLAFEKLKAAGIFHETPESAARQMADVWDDVDGWWQSDAIQIVRREFCERYANVPVRPLDRMEDLLRDAAAGGARVGSIH